MKFSKIVSLFLLIPFLLQAQTEKDVLQLRECVDIALENNPNVNTSRNLAEMARLGVKKSYSNIMPKLDASLSGASLRFGESTFLQDVPIGVDPETGNIIYDQQVTVSPARTRESYSAGIDVRQNIFDGGFWWNNIKRNKVLSQQGQADLKLSENQVIKLVSQYYFDLLKNIKLLEVYSLTVNRSQAQLDRTQSMYEIGSVAQVDVFRARVNLGQDKISFLNQQNTVRQSKQLLNLSMGRDPLVPIEIDTSITVETKTVSIEELLERSLTEQPGLRSAELEVKSRELNVALNKSAYWPTLGAQYNYSRDNEELEKIYTDFDQNWSSYIGVRFSWNLFNGFSDKVDVQTSKLDLKNARLSLADYKRSLRSDIQHLYNTYNAILEIVDINRGNLEAASEEYRLANERYRLGSGTSLELREAQVNLTEAEQILVAAEYNTIITYIELLEAAGFVKESLNF